TLVAQREVGRRAAAVILTIAYSPQRRRSGWGLIRPLAASAIRRSGPAGGGIRPRKCRTDPKNCLAAARTFAAQTSPGMAFISVAGAPPSRSAVLRCSNPARLCPAQQSRRPIPRQTRAAGSGGEGTILRL